MWSCLSQSRGDANCWFSSHFSFSRCHEPQGGLASLIHNQVGGSEGSSPTHLHWRQFPSKWGVGEANFSSFFSGLPFPEFLSFSQRLLTSSYTAVLVISNLDLSLSSLLLMKISVFIKTSAQMFQGAEGQGGKPFLRHFHSSDSSQGTPIFKKHLDAFLISSRVGFSLQNKGNLCNLFPFLICLVEVHLSDWCWGARAKHCSGGKIQAC